MAARGAPTKTWKWETAAKLMIPSWCRKRETGAEVLFGRRRLRKLSALAASASTKVDPKAGWDPTCGYPGGGFGQVSRSGRRLWPSKSRKEPLAKLPREFTPEPPGQGKEAGGTRAQLQTGRLALSACVFAHHCVRASWRPLGATSRRSMPSAWVPGNRGLLEFASWRPFGMSWRSSGSTC